MKSQTIKRITSICLILLTLTALVFSLTSCISKENKDHAEKMTRQVIDGIIANDFEAVYSIFKEHISVSDFRVGYDQIIDHFDGIKSYELEQIGWHVYSQNGITTYSVTFRMTCDNNEILLIESTFLKGNNEFYSFNVAPSAPATETDIIPLQFIFILGSIYIFGFTVWAFIDCMIRKIEKKALWIIIILLGFSLTLTVGQSTGINFSLALIFPLSIIQSDGFSTSMTFALPIGAIIYLIVCRKLPKRVPFTFKSDTIFGNEQNNAANPNSDNSAEKTNTESGNTNPNTSDSEKVTDENNTQQ